MNGSATLRLVVQAALKLDARTPAWRNAVAFIQSCYGCRVREYDYDQAMAAIARLSDEEQAGHSVRLDLDDPFPPELDLVLPKPAISVVAVAGNSRGL